MLGKFGKFSLEFMACPGSLACYVMQLQSWYIVEDLSVLLWLHHTYTRHSVTVCRNDCKAANVPPGLQQGRRVGALCSSDSSFRFGPFVAEIQECRQQWSL